MEKLLARVLICPQQGNITVDGAEGPVTCVLGG
jgi:hypothetical protein